MEKGEDMTAYKARLITSHISNCLSKQQTGSLPMILGMQGPQGSGKTTIANEVKKRLEKGGSRVAVLSLDDLYKTHDELKHLEEHNPSNTLLHGRGQPGTHDMELGNKVLSQLKSSPPGTKISLPIFDKSLYSGKGDRSSSTIDVTTPLDVVIFEGWCMGFYPLSDMDLQRKWHHGPIGREEDAPWNFEAKAYVYRSHHLKSLLQINHYLESFLDWYDYIDAFVQLKPENLDDVYTWRLQAEHAMKATGKDGMTDEQVHQFVARYMPGYELFGDGVVRPDTPWVGKGLQITINADREVTNITSF